MSGLATLFQVSEVIDEGGVVNGRYCFIQQLF